MYKNKKIYTLFHIVALNSVTMLIGLLPKVVSLVKFSTFKAHFTLRPGSIVDPNPVNK